MGSAVYKNRYIFFALTLLASPLFSETVSWGEKAARGDAEYQFKWGKELLSLDGYSNRVEAVKWLKLSAEQDNADALFLLGRCYEQGAGIKKDDTEAFSLYYKAVYGKLPNEVRRYRSPDIPDTAHEKALFRLGYFYLRGIGTPENTGLGWHLIEAAAEEKEAEAAYMMGLRLYPNPKDSILQEQTKLEELGIYFGPSHWSFVLAHAENREAAKWKVREAYATQFHVWPVAHAQLKEDCSEVMKWLTLAAKKGHADAQFWLGNCYIWGITTKYNEKKALYWWRKAAKQLHEPAIRSIEVVSPK